MEGINKPEGESRKISVYLENGGSPVEAEIVGSSIDLGGRPTLSAKVDGITKTFSWIDNMWIKDPE